MLKRLLATAGTLGILVCGATIGLESVGVLFYAGTPDPEQERAEAFLARLEAEVSPADLPTEPVELPTEAVQDRPLPDAEAVAPAHIAAPGAGVPIAEGPPPADPVSDRGEQIALAPGGKVEDPLAEAQPKPEAAPQPATAHAPGPPVIHEPEPAAAPVQLAAQATDAPAAARPARPQQLGAAARARPAHAGVGRYVSFGCPFLDWLDAVIDPAGAQVADRPVAAWCPG